MEASQVERLLEIMVALWPIPEWSEATLYAYRERLGGLPQIQTEEAIRKLADESERRPSVAEIVKATRGTGVDLIDVADARFRSKFEGWQRGEEIPREKRERVAIAGDLRRAAGRERRPHADNEAWQALLEDMAEHYETSTDQNLFKNCPKISDYLGQKANAGMAESAYARGPSKTVEEARERSATRRRPGNEG